MTVPVLGPRGTQEEAENQEVGKGSKATPAIQAPEEMKKSFLRGVTNIVFLGSMLLGAWTPSELAFGEQVDLGSPKITHLPDHPITLSLQEGLPVMIGGRGPYRVSLDTGQSIPCLLSRDLAKELDLKVIEQLQPGDGSDLKGPSSDLVEIPYLSLGEATFHDLKGLVIDSAQNDATLGFGLFLEGLLTLDFARGTLDLRQGQLPPYSTDTLPYTAEYGIPTIDIGIADLTIPVLLDSGSPRYLMLPKKLSEKLPLRGKLRSNGVISSLFNRSPLWTASLDGFLRIGQREILYPVTDFTGLTNEAILGRPFLEQYVLTFDTVHQRLQLRSLELE